MNDCFLWILRTNGPWRGLPEEFGPWSSVRNVVERLVGWLRESRRIFSRFEKTPKNFAGMIKMAFIRPCLILATS